MTIKKFWDSCHRNKKVSALSGVTYENTVNIFKIKDLIKPGIKVLEVGVGLGYVVEGFHNKGAIVSCLDISDVAIAHVKDYCEKTYTLDNLKELPSNYFDVITCGNVVQHIDTKLLKIELKHIIRSLKESGVFSVEFVSNNTVEDSGLNPSERTIKHGGCCRTPVFLEGLINNAGGLCELIYDHEIKGNATVQGCHIFRVTKIKHPSALKHKKVFVTGVYGSGKSTLANQVSNYYNYPIVDFDVLFKYNSELCQCKKILNKLEKMGCFIMDAIPLSISSNIAKQRMYTWDMFSKWEKKNDVQIICSYCPEKVWIKRVKKRQKIAIDIHLDSYRRFYSANIQMINTFKNVLFWDSNANEYTTKQIMLERTKNE